MLHVLRFIVVVIAVSKTKKFSGEGAMPLPPVGRGTPPIGAFGASIRSPRKNLTNPTLGYRASPLGGGGQE